MATPSWDHCRTLLAVLESGSLSGAARRLGLSQPTAGRHIEQLEADFGQPLFTRSPAGLKPTDFALGLERHLETMAAAAEAAIRDASAETSGASGVVRLTAPDMLGVEVLPDILRGFCDRHPAIVVELDLSNRAEDLLRRQADIAVRTFRPEQGSLLARKVGVMPVRLFAHRRYLEAHGAPKGLQDPHHRSVGFDRDAQTEQALRAAGAPLNRDLFGFRADNQLAQLAAVRAGIGIGGVQVGLARRNPDLIEVLEGMFPYELEIWVVMHEDLKSSRRMRLMFDALVEGLAAYVREARPS
jgi:DNA-binding transcriptional LysR family regulator